MKSLVSQLEILSKRLTGLGNHLESWTGSHFPELFKYFKQLNCTTVRAVLRTYWTPVGIAREEPDVFAAWLYRVSRSKVSYRKAYALHADACATTGVDNDLALDIMGLCRILSDIERVRADQALLKAMLKKMLSFFPESKYQFL